MFRRPPPRNLWPKLGATALDLVGRFQSGRTPSSKDLIVSEETLQVYVNAYRRSGFHGGINLYRNLDRNWALMEGRDQSVRAPSLWIGADLDLFLPPETADGMETLVPDLEKYVIEGAGHWVMWEKPDALNRLIVNWLRQRFSN